jgi:anti-sigma B factor antagonist
MGQVRMQGFQILRLAPDTGRANSSAGRHKFIPDLRSLSVALAPEQGIGHIDADDGGSGMISALLRGWRKITGVEETRLESGEIAIHIVPAINQLTAAVAGRVTVDSSPHLRSVLLDLLHRAAAPAMVIDLSAVSYLDMSGIATLLEALKAAHENSVTLHVRGISGQVSTLAEVAQLDAIFHSLGSEVEFR